MLSLLILLQKKLLKNKEKTIEDQGRKKIDAITNQNERLAGLTNKNDHKDNVKEIFEKLVKKRFDDFNNGLELFGEIKSGEMKLEEAKNCRMYFNQI